ncbi:MAG: hypothetical protein H7210_00255 [Pyrinomonadaceae bacterium]|nr:hypothetical protein [Phycisphaerales bacterium]
MGSPSGVRGGGMAYQQAAHHPTDDSVKARVGVVDSRFSTSPANSFMPD